VETELLLRHPSIGLANTSPQIALAKLSRRKAYHLQLYRGSLSGLMDFSNENALPRCRQQGDRLLHLAVL
jgi:hypothetical protein